MDWRLAVTDLRKQVEGLRLSLDEVLNALNEASEGREWYGPKPDLLSNALNRAIKRKAEASLAEPVEAGAGQIKICALCETPMKLAQGIGYFCPIMGCENRDGLYKLVESREEPPAGEPRCQFHDKPKEFCGSCANEMTEPYQKAIASGELVTLESVLGLVELRTVRFGKKVYFAGFSVQGNSRAAQAVKRMEKLKDAIKTALATREAGKG